MKRKKRAFYPPLEKQNTYISKIAVILYRITAIFCSTGFFVFASNSTHNGNILHTRRCVLWHICAFLFHSIADKPCYNPGCRSPPFFLSFKDFERKEGQAVFDKDKFFYKNEDYTVRMQTVNGCEKYFIKFHGAVYEPEYEVKRDIFMLYLKEFNKPLEKQKNEQRRHIEDGEIDDFIVSGKLSVSLMEQEWINRIDFEAALKTCTQVQQRRFKMHYIHGYSMDEIAEMENCSKQSVSRSVAFATKKIKIFLF